jgi:hypothetical protein
MPTAAAAAAAAADPESDVQLISRFNPATTHRTELHTSADATATGAYHSDESRSNDRT